MIVSDPEKAFKTLKENNFLVDKAANIIIRAADIDDCIEKLHKHEMELMRASELYKL